MGGMSESNRNVDVAGRRRTLRASIAAAVMVALVAPVVPLRAPVVEAAGEAGNATPAAVEDRVVLPAVGGTITLRGIDTDGDDLAFTIGSPFNVSVDSPTTPVCEVLVDGTKVCTATVTATLTASSGYFDYSVGDGAASDSARIYVDNGVPTAMGTELVASPGSVTTVTLRGVDPDGDNLAFVPGSVFGGTLGAVSTPVCVVQADGANVCTATVEFTGTTSTSSYFTYAVADAFSTSNTARIDVTNPGPTAIWERNWSVRPGTTVTLRGVDPNGDSLSFELSGTPSLMTVGPISAPVCVAQGDGSSVCTATVDVLSLTNATLASFSYRVGDGVSFSNTASVDVRNPPPVAMADQVVASPGGVTTVTLRGVDPNGDSLSFEVPGTPSLMTVGSISAPVCVAQGDGSSVCTATVDVSSLTNATLASFSYRVGDGVSFSANASVVVRNPPPVAMADQVVASPGGVTTVTLRGVDPNGDSLSFELSGTPSLMTVGSISAPVCVAQGDGSSVCTATVDVSSLTNATLASFSYRVGDGVSFSASASVVVRNPPPTAIGDRLTGVTGPVTATLRGIDPNGDPLTVSVTTVSGGTVGAVAPPVCTPQSDGSNVCSATVEFTPSGTSGSVNFSVSDGVSSNTASVAIVAATTSPNALPRAVADRVVVSAAGGTVTLRGLDADGDDLSFSVVGDAVGGDGGDDRGAGVCGAARWVVGVYGVGAGDADGFVGFVRVQCERWCGDVDVGHGERDERAPRAVADRVVVSAAGGTVTLRGLDADGDDLSFSVVGDAVGGDGGDDRGAGVCGAAGWVVGVYGVGAGDADGFVGFVRVQCERWCGDVDVGHGERDERAPRAVADRVVVSAAGGTVTLRGLDADGDDLSFSVVGDAVGGDGGDDRGAGVCGAARWVVGVYGVGPGDADGFVGFVRVQCERWCGDVDVGHGERDERAPRAVADRVVVSAAGGTVTLRGLDADGDDLSFSVVGDAVGGDGGDDRGAGVCGAARWVVGVYGVGAGDADGFVGFVRVQCERWCGDVDVGHGQRRQSDAVRRRFPTSLPGRRAPMSRFERSTPTVTWSRSQ
jgi:hypothetical protein